MWNISSCLAGVSLNSSSDDGKNSVHQSIQSPSFSFWSGDADLPAGTLHEIHLENLRLQEENKQLRQQCQEIERKQREFDIHKQAEEIKKV